MFLCTSFELRCCGRTTQGVRCHAIDETDSPRLCTVLHLIRRLEDRGNKSYIHACDLLDEASLRHVLYETMGPEFRVFSMCSWTHYRPHILS